MRALSIVLVLLVIQTGCAVNEPRQKETAVTTIAFSPDQQLAAFGNSEEIWVFEIEKRVRINLLRDAPQEVKNADPYSLRHGVGDSMVFLDNNRIASTGMGGMVTIWDVHDGRRLAVIDSPDSGVFATSIAWSSVKSRLVVGTRDGRLLLTELNGNKAAPWQSVAKLSGYIHNLVFGENGRYFASAGGGSGVVIWDADLLQRFGNLNSTNGVLDMSLVPGSASLLTAGPEIQIWRFLTQDEAEEIKDPNMVLQSLGIGTATGMLAGVLAIAGANFEYGAGSIATEAAADLLILESYMPQSAHACWRTAAISPDGKTIVSTTQGPSHNVLSVIDRESNKVTEKMSTRDYVCDLEFSPSGKHVLAATSEGLFFYDTATWRETNFKSRYSIRRKTSD